MFCRRCSIYLGMLALVGSASAADTPRALFTFDDASAAESLIALNGLPLEVAAPPEAAAAGGLQGSALHLKSDGQAGAYTKREAITLDWPKVRKLTFWVYRSPEAAAADDVTQIELQCVEQNGKTRFWRRVDIDHSGWKQYEVPLQWLRWSTGRIPQWNAVVRFGFWFREAGDIWIDDVAAVESTEPNAAELSAEELRDFTFPDANDNVKLERGKHVTLITDEADLDAPQLAAHLDKAAAAIAADFPFLGEVPQGRLIVFAAENDYRRFTVRTAEKLNSEAQPPQSSGFTFWGIATSFWDPSFGTLRPVYLHEFVHSYLDDAIELDNYGEWLHEGLASHYQLRFHPQDNFSEIVHTSLLAERFAPLDQLTNGQKIAMEHYWQAATVADMLLHDAAYAPKLEALLTKFREAGSTDVRSHLAEVYGKSYEDLTADWKTWCGKKY